MPHGTDHLPPVCGYEMHSIAIRSYIQHIFAVAGKGRDDVAPHLHKMLKFSGTGVKGNNPLVHSTQINGRTDTGDIVKSTHMLAVFYIMIGFHFSVGQS